MTDTQSTYSEPALDVLSACLIFWILSVKLGKVSAGSGVTDTRGFVRLSTVASKASAF